jgi:hypothetical protein
MSPGFLTMHLFESKVGKEFNQNNAKNDSKASETNKKSATRK